MKNTPGYFLYPNTLGTMGIILFQMGKYFTIGMIWQTVN
jgi:hypothetical protein